MFKFAENKLSILGVWKDSLKLYAATIKKVWYLSVFSMLVITIDTRIGPEMKHLKNVTSLAHIWPFLLLAVLTVLIYIFISTVVLHRMYYLAKEDNYPLSKSISTVLVKIATVFVVILLYAVCSYLGLLLMIAPGVVILVTFIFALPFVLFDNTSWFEGFKNSAKLVWSIGAYATIGETRFKVGGNWWRTLILTFVPLFLLGVINALFNKLAGYLGFHSIFLYFIPAAIFGILKPIIDAVVLVQFQDLKLRYKISAPPKQTSP